MKLNMIRFILLVALSVIGVSAQATVTGFSDLATWQTADTTAGLTSINNITFAGQIGQAGNDGSTFSVSGISFTPVTSGGAWYICQWPASCGNYGNSGSFYSHQNNSGLHDIYVSFASAVNAVSFGAQMLGNSQPVSITLSNGDSYSFAAAASANAPLFNFGGLVDTHSFTSMHIVASNAVGLDIQNFSVAAVPEAETYAMMLAGLALIGFVMYRRKNDASGMFMAA